MLIPLSYQCWLRLIVLVARQDFLFLAETNFAKIAVTVVFSQLSLKF